jgi:Fe-S-cluster containining protein
LSEAAALADVFVFRLMFRLYWLPRQVADYRNLRARAVSSDAIFYQKKRLLSAFAAHTSSVRLRQNGSAVEHTRYLVISALPLDTSPGRCSALDEIRCAIYGRRPLSCRSVPLHYSRPDALAASDLDTFVATPDYRCDTSPSAPIVLDSGRIVDAGLLEARATALAIAERDRPWWDAIVRRMKSGRAADAPLPHLREIEENAAFGATTTSMCVAWRVAAEAGLIGANEFRTLIATQLTTIAGHLAIPSLSPDARQTLQEMEFEYRHALDRAQA